MDDDLLSCQPRRRVVLQRTGRIIHVYIKRHGTQARAHTRIHHVDSHACTHSDAQHTRTHPYDRSCGRPRHRRVSHPEGERSSASRPLSLPSSRTTIARIRSVSDQRQIIADRRRSIRLDSPTIRRRSARRLCATRAYWRALASRNLDNPADINASRNHGGCRLASIAPFN